MELKTWAVTHVKSTASMRGEKVQIEDMPDGFIAHYDSRDKLYYITPQIKHPPNEDSQSYCTIIALNSEANIDALVEHWENYSKLPKLRVLFANPETGEHWSINPHIHDLITERKGLKKGLQSIASSITIYPSQ